MPNSDKELEVYLSDLSPKDKTWDAHRAKADEVAHLYNSVDYKRYAEQIGSCSRWLEFALVSDDLGMIALKLQSASCCRNRTCPICQWRRSLMWRGRFLKVMPKILADYPTHRWIFLTFTIRNPDITDLRSTINLMNKAWDRLTKRARFPAEGYVKVIEVTKEKESSAAHPHIHAILMVPGTYFVGRNYLSKSQWIELWQKSLQVEYAPSIDVKAVKPKNASKTPQTDLSGGLVQAVLETLKYAVKEADLVADACWLQELTRQIQGLRFITVSGILRKYLSAQENNENLIHVDEVGNGEAREGDPRLWFDWATEVKKYRNRKHKGADQ